MSSDQKPGDSPETNSKMTSERTANVLLRPVVHNPLVRPAISWGKVALVGEVTLDSHD